MKKIFILIIIIVMSIVMIMFAKYSEFTHSQNKIKSINKEFLAYEESTIQINKIVTLMNRAIVLNRSNNIRQNENKIFEENDTNSIKIYLETKSTKDEVLVKVPMEELILSNKSSIEKVEYAFADVKFKMTEKEYHKKTGQIKKIVFTEQN